MRVVLVGRSGTRKSELVKELKKRLNFDSVLQATTAKKKGDYYKVVSEETFQDMVDSGHFVSETLYGGNRYGVFEVPEQSVVILSPRSVEAFRDRYGREETKVVLLESSHDRESDRELVQDFEELKKDKSVVVVDAEKDQGEIVEELVQILKEAGFTRSLEDILKEILKEMDTKNQEQLDFLERYFEATMVFVASNLGEIEYDEIFSGIIKDLDRWVVDRYSEKEKYLDTMLEMREEFRETLEKLKDVM